MDETGLRLAVDNLNPRGSVIDTPSQRQAASRALTPAGSFDAKNPQSTGQNVLRLTIEQVPHMAYMLNHQFEVIWLNDTAQAGLPGLPQPLPPTMGDRSIFKLLLEGDDALTANHTAMLRMNLALAKEIVPLENILRPLHGMPAARLGVLEQLYSEVESFDANMARARHVVNRVPLRLASSEKNHEHLETEHTAFATCFREGIFIVVSPRESDASELQRFLGRRDIVKHTLLSKRMPVLCDMVVSATTLQDSAKIRSELPPDEYFELITQIWSLADEMFRAHYGTRGKDAGDGLVGYFFPQPDSHYLMNAVHCALVLKTAMARLSKAWQLRKNWSTELYLNCGLNAGHEWLGAIHSANSETFVVLGEIVNHTSHLSNLARFGRIWATKNSISKIPTEARKTIDFGIERTNAHGQRNLAPSSYARVSTLPHDASMHANDLRDIAHLAVTEIRNVRH